MVMKLQGGSGIFSKAPARAIAQPEFPEITDGRYVVRLARGRREIDSALRLRHDVFRVELGKGLSALSDDRTDFDAYDLKCRHLIVLLKDTGETIGTYRLNTLETAHSSHGFYSASEFTIEELPSNVLRDGIEIGRACIARDHRNTKVLFLLWKALLAYLEMSGKRFFFGCCSIFTQDAEVGRKAYRQLIRDGNIHDVFNVRPSRNALSLVDESSGPEEIELPPLFNMYLRLGARVCGPPMVDREFGTIDFFVVFDVSSMAEKYRRLFAAR